MKIIDAIAVEAMPFGTYVEVGGDGFARPDPTFTLKGGVVKRAPGIRNACDEGEAVKVQTEGPVQMLTLQGMNVPVNLEGGRILGGPGAVPGLRGRT